VHSPPRPPVVEDHPRRHVLLYYRHVRPGGHEDAMLSFRDASVEKIMKLAEWVRKLKGTVQVSQVVSKSGSSN
jgi:hypothetical protein